ncbi:MAG: hypothetical protein A3G70_03995 [Planctomycetes bacterium RIFCSPLOWO2_12_FULL_39_13]|nr:MAG: hypothetical protein A3G70_03995 [Planctomycetes bacterium RIFCSPLOWO2_12_FULL_39_13]
MDEERLTILKSELLSQLDAIEDIYKKLEDRRKKRGKAGVESIGYQLHNLYCAFEDLFKIVAESFENHIQDKAKYHMELLKRMTISIEGIRPLLLTQESYVLLDNLRSFRHFFRHAYSYEVDIRKVRIVLEDADKLREFFKRDIAAFLAQLTQGGIKNSNE